MNPHLANYAHQTHSELIVGTGRVGKTSLWMQHIAQHKSRPKWIFDHTGQFCQRVGIMPARTLVEMNEATRRGVCAYVPLPHIDAARAFRFFCDYAFSIGSEMKGPKLFACDEFQNYTDTSKLPPEMGQLLDYGPHYEMDFFSVSRSPNLTNHRLRNLITHCIAFKATDDNALKFLKGVGFDTEAVKALPKFHFIQWERDADPSRMFTTGKSQKI